MTNNEQDGMSVANCLLCRLRTHEPGRVNWIRCPGCGHNISTRVYPASLRGVSTGTEDK